MRERVGRDGEIGGGFVVILVPAVAKFVGSHPERLVGSGGCSVWRGGGFVAKCGTGANREAHVLSGAVGALPLAAPELVAAGDGWVVMRDVADSADPWDERDLVALLVDLAALHDRFDGIDAEAAGPLAVGPGEALARWRVYGRREHVVLPTRLLRVLEDPSPLLKILDDQPTTLVHGDAYPGNVLRPRPGQRVWIDWEDSLVGPAVFDLAAFFGNGPWMFGRALSRRKWLEPYRAALGTHRPALDEAFDAALLLWTLSQSLDDLLVERGATALEAFVSERIDALDQLGL